MSGKRILSQSSLSWVFKNEQKVLGNQRLYMYGGDVIYIWQISFCLILAKPYLTLYCTVVPESGFLK